MAYDMGLVERIKQMVKDQPGLTEKKMFGGVGYLINGNMACGVIKDELVVRLGEVKNAEALDQPFTRQFDFSGKPMAGWIFVEKRGFKSDVNLQKWVSLGVEYALSLPPK